MSKVVLLGQNESCRYCSNYSYYQYYYGFILHYLLNFSYFLFAFFLSSVSGIFHFFSFHGVTLTLRDDMVRIIKQK